MTENAKDLLNRIRKEIKLSRIEQKGKELSIIQKNLGRSKSYSPIEKDLLYTNLEESSQLKKYLDARFDRIDSNIKEIKEDSNYSLLINGLNHNLYDNEIEVRETLRKYINNKYNNLAKDTVNVQNIEIKNNERNKNNNYVQQKNKEKFPKKVSNLNNIINQKKRNIKKEGSSANKTQIQENKFELNINKKNFPSFLDLYSKSQRQTIKSIGSKNIRNNILYSNSKIAKLYKAKANNKIKMVTKEEKLKEKHE